MFFVCYAEIDVVKPKSKKSFVNTSLYPIKVLKIESCLMAMPVGNTHVLSIVVNITKLCTLRGDSVRNVIDQRSCSKTSCYGS